MVQGKASKNSSCYFLRGNKYRLSLLFRVAALKKSISSVRYLGSLEFLFECGVLTEIIIIRRSRNGDGDMV